MGVSETNSIDNRLMKSFEIGNIKNKVMIGVDYYKNKTDGVNNGFGFAPPIDMFNPVHQSTPYHFKWTASGGWNSLYR